MLAGGLGNLLFQVASAYGLARQNRCLMAIDPATRWRRAAHSAKNYFDPKTGFLSAWMKFARPVRATHTITEHKLHPIQLIPGATIFLEGYLQNYSYFWPVLDEIMAALRFDPTVAARYPRIHESAFLHIRGGDYRGHWLHGIDLTEYYTRAIRHVAAPHYYVFTNDRDYLGRQTWLANVLHTVVDENEVASLYLMSRCARGAICANSTFSWWGAALRSIERPICMPDKWFNDPAYYIQGYFFPGVTVLPV